MGNADTKLHFRKAVIQLTTKTSAVSPADDAFWAPFWSESVSSVQDVFALVPSAEIRALREESPSNLATLCYKAVEKLVVAADNSCRTHTDHVHVLNSARILTRLMPYIFEEPDWANFFWTSVGNNASNTESIATESNELNRTGSLAEALLSSVCDLLFCPDFTVSSSKWSSNSSSVSRDEAEELQTLDSCEYIWMSGVGFANRTLEVGQHNEHRTELLRLLATCFSQSMYCENGSNEMANLWVQQFTSSSNRHALPLFTSLLNTVCAYEPASGLLPYNHLLFSDSKQQLVEMALQVLVICLDGVDTLASGSNESFSNLTSVTSGMGSNDNLFVNYLSRIHREEDLNFILSGITRLLMNPLQHTYLPNSQRRLHCHQELLILFWQLCEHNKKFLFFVLKSSHVLAILTPILYHLNAAKADSARLGLVHIGVFILLLLSGERNFGVRLNKPYVGSLAIPMLDVAAFTGTHADLLVIVIHKIVTTGQARLQPLFDCLLTILCNVSPYLKSLSMVASNKLLHLLEAFSTPWFLFSAPQNHHLVFFLLEIFNNIVQYQFDGNANLVYCIIRKRHVFHQLANLPTDCGAITRTLTKRAKNKSTTTTATTTTATTTTATSTTTSTTTTSAASTAVAGPTSPTTLTSPSSEHAGVVLEQQNVVSNSSVSKVSSTNADLLNELKATLMEAPGLEAMTERESGHPSQTQLDKLIARGGTTLFSTHNEYQGDNKDKDNDDIGDKVDAFDLTPKSNNNNNNTDKLLRQTSGTSTTTGVEATSKASVVSKASVISKASVVSKASAVSKASTAGDPRWVPTQEWVQSWKSRLPLQTLMRLLQVLVPQVEKICIDKGLTDESEILRFLQHGTLVGLLPVPHPILIRKYQANPGTVLWFRTYMWGVLYLRNADPPIWYDTDVKLFQIQRI